MTTYDADGKPKRRRVKKFRLDEISLVDKPAHGPARVAIMKRAPDTSAVEPIQKKLAMTTVVDGHSHSLIMVGATSEGLAELRAGQTSFVDGHVHDWIMDENGLVTISEAAGHGHEVAVLLTKADLKNLLPEEGALAELLQSGTDSVSNEAAETIGDSSEDTMSKQNDQAADDKTQAVTQEQIDELTKRNERLAEIVKLSPEQRAYFDGLNTEGQDEFLGTEDKDAVVKNAADSDPVVYKATDGREFRKSADSDLVAEVKRGDEMQKRLDESDALTKRAGFEKRAKEELEHLTGEDMAKADLLEAVETLPEEKREPVLAILKSKDAGMAKAFETVGTSDDGDGEGASADSKIQAIAKGIREQNPKITPEQAYVQALDTPEGRELQSELAG